MLASNRFVIFPQRPEISQFKRLVVTAGEHLKVLRLVALTDALDTLVSFSKTKALFTGELNALFL